MKINHYGREVPKSGHGSVNLGKYSSSSNLIIEAVADLFDRVVDKNLFIRRINVTANHVMNETEVPQPDDVVSEQLDLFESPAEQDWKKAEEQAKLDKEKRLQRAILDIKRKMGKNAMLRGMNLLEGATAKERNQQVGGHRE
jgi:DNA polymerase V